MHDRITQYKLRNLGLALTVNMLLGLAMRLIPQYLPFAGAATQSTYALWRYIVSLASGLLTLAVARAKKGYGLLLFASIAALVASLTLTFYEHFRKMDSLVDLNLFLQGIIIYVLLQIIGDRRKWRKIVQSPPNALDLRIDGKKDLFNRMVIAPHLEMNADILSAVDRYLEIATQLAPLTLCIHSAEPIAEQLQQVARDGFQMYYQDEERKIRHDLQSRYALSVWMIVISISAFRFLSNWHVQSDNNIVFEILGSFAAFSLWKVGDTFFERSEAMDRLARVLIAKNTDIQFL